MDTEHWRSASHPPWSGNCKHVRDEAFMGLGSTGRPAWALAGPLGLPCLLLSGFCPHSQKGPGFPKMSRQRPDPPGTHPTAGPSMWVEPWCGLCQWLMYSHKSLPGTLNSLQKRLLPKDHGIIYFQWFKSKDIGLTSCGTKWTPVHIPEWLLAWFYPWPAFLVWARPQAPCAPLFHVQNSSNELY